MGLRRSETSGSLAKIKDEFQVEGGEIQSHSSQETQPQLEFPTGPRSLVAQASSTLLLRQMQEYGVQTPNRLQPLTVPGGEKSNVLLQ